jgi:hypothetical protein
MKVPKTVWGTWSITVVATGMSEHSTSEADKLDKTGQLSVVTTTAMAAIRKQRNSSVPAVAPGLKELAKEKAVGHLLGRLLFLFR